jgi:mannosyltransferase
MAATHVLALLIVPVQVAVLVVARRWKGRSALLYGAAGLAPAAALLIYILLNNGRQTSWIARPGSTVLHRFFTSIIGADHWILAYAALAVFGLVAAFRRGGLMDRLVSVAAVVAFVGPIAVVWVVSQARPLFVDRYLIFVLPALVLLLAQGIVRAPGGTAVVVALTVGLSLHALHMDQPLLSQRMNVEDIRAAARQVASEGRSGDALLFDPAWARPGFEHFSRRLPIRPKDVALAPGGRHDDMVLATELDPAQIEDRLQGIERVWVVGYGEDVWDIAPEPATAVRAQHVGRDWIEVEHRTYGEFEVTLYDINRA